MTSQEGTAFVTSSLSKRFYTTSAECETAPFVSSHVQKFWDWVRNTTGLSLQYHDVVVNIVGGFMRATDASLSTGYVDPGFVSPTPAAANSHNDLPKMLPMDTADSWSVSAPLPAGAIVISEASINGLDIALYGIFPSTYDRIVDSLHYTAAQCMASKAGRTIKCADATSSVTVSLRDSYATLVVKARRRDISLSGATGLKTYLWLDNGDNYLIYNSDSCKRVQGRKIRLRC